MEWISTKDRWPEPGSTVLGLLYHRTGDTGQNPPRIVVLYFDEHSDMTMWWRWDDDSTHPDCFTHWMPMPGLPDDLKPNDVKWDEAAAPPNPP